MENLYPCSFKWLKSVAATVLYFFFTFLFFYGRFFNFSIVVDVRPFFSSLGQRSHVLALQFPYPSCVMFRVELKSSGESRVLLGKRFSSVQGFSERQWNKWLECVSFSLRVCKTTGTYTGYRSFSVQSYFNTSLLSEVGSKNKEYSHKMCFLVHAQTGRNKISETSLSSVIKTWLRAET